MTLALEIISSPNGVIDSDFVVRSKILLPK